MFEYNRIHVYTCILIKPFLYYHFTFYSLLLDGKIIKTSLSIKDTSSHNHEHNIKMFNQKSGSATNLYLPTSKSPISSQELKSLLKAQTLEEYPPAPLPPTR